MSYGVQAYAIRDTPNFIFQSTGQSFQIFDVILIFIADMLT